MLELIAGILLAAGATYYVLLPVLRPPAEPAGGGASAADEGEDPEDDLSPQTVALRALKEIEFDRATGKLSDADYEQLKAKYTGEALAAMRGDVGRVTGDEATQRPRLPSPVPRPTCPDHGPRPELDAVFCSECGRRLGSAPGYCARCGSGLETDARYCNRCGARVAA
jgi:hypothetical protein